MGILGCKVTVSEHCCRYPRTGVPLLLCLGKSLVVILNYALTAEQPDPCGPEPYSPGKRPRTHPPLGEGPVTPRVPEEVALSQNSWRPREYRTPVGSRTPQQGGTDTPPGLVRSPHVSAGVGTRAEPRGFHWKTRLPTAFNAVGRSALCHSRARGGFCQVALLVACAVAGTAHAAYVSLLCQLDVTARLRPL